MDQSDQSARCNQYIQLDRLPCLLHQLDLFHRLVRFLPVDRLPCLPHRSDQCNPSIPLGLLPCLLHQLSRSDLAVRSDLLSCCQHRLGQSHLVVRLDLLCPADQSHQTFLLDLLRQYPVGQWRRSFLSPRLDRLSCLLHRLDQYRPSDLFLPGDPLVRILRSDLPMDQSVRSVLRQLHRWVRYLPVVRLDQ